MKIIITAFIVLFFSALSVSAANYVVSSNADSGAGTLRQVITDANDDAATPHTITFSGVSSITLASALPSINKTMTIDGGAGVTIIGFSSTTNIVTSGAVTTTFKYITFSGAIVSLGGTGTFNNCTFTGGGASALKVTFAVTCNNCLFYGNTNSGSGGTAINGISSTNDLAMNDCVIRDNGNPTSNANGGAAIRVAGGNATSRLEMNNCLVYNNVNKSTGTSFGGGISSAGVTTINNCAIYDNQANRGGGLALQVGSATYKSKLTMTNTTVSGNSLGSYVGSAFGGGIYIQGGVGLLTDNCTITNSTISGNSTPAIGIPVTTSTGGGIQIGGGGSSTWTPVITISNSTIYGNNVQGNPTSAISGGGIDRNNGNAVLNYSIVIGNNSNSTANGRNITFTSGWLTSTTGRNMYEGGAGWNGTETAENIILSDAPSTVINTTLADNGGITTLPDGSFVKTHALLLGTVAINPQPPTAGWSAIDQRGANRDSAPDMGAYEYVFFPAPVLASLIAGDGQLTVHFNQQNEGDAPVENYKYSTDAGATYIACTPAQTVSPITITGLHNSSWYSVRLKAMTSTEESAESNLMTTTLPSDNEVEPTYVVLLAGQSNMAGRGVIRIPMDTVSYANIISLNKDTVWVTARNPIHYDKPEASVGMGMTFAADLARLFNNKVRIALVPCAVGGSNIKQWLNDDFFTSATASFNIYSNLINRAKAAQKTGRIIGVLWHQGESDGITALNTNYQSDLQTLVNQIRHDLAISDLPFIAGEMGKYFNAPNSASVNADSISRYTNNLKSVLSNYDVATSEGLTANPDRIHFNSSSLVMFGQRYAELLRNQLVEISVPNVTSGNIQRISIPVNIEKYVPAEINQLGFTFNYNPDQFSYEGYSLQDLIGTQGNMEISQVLPGKLLISWTSEVSISGSGTLFNINLTPKNEGRFNIDIQEIRINNTKLKSVIESEVVVTASTSNLSQINNNIILQYDKVSQKIYFSGINEPSVVKILDTTGRQINQYDVSNNGLNVSNLISGIYIVSVLSGGKHQVFKFIK